MIRQYIGLTSLSLVMIALSASNMSMYAGELAKTLPDSKKQIWNTYNFLCVHLALGKLLKVGFSKPQWMISNDSALERAAAPLVVPRISLGVLNRQRIHRTQ